MLSYIKNLIRQNSYLKQEIIFYKKSKNAMVAFFNKALVLFNILELASKNFF